MELNRVVIDSLREDIIKYKNKNYKYTTWLLPEKREHFVRDYMRDRGLNTDFAVYEQACYIVMCMGWTMHPERKERE